jgi:group II intron reverse transcriptase/maturase
MQTSLRGIARKAKQNKNHRFGNLYGLLNKDALYLAWRELNRKAATGVDGETVKDFEKNLDRNLETIVEELKSKRYKAKLVKRVNIPKGNGKIRPLGLQALRDKIVQKAVANILEAIYEQDFLKCSYGYRPNTGAQKAVRDLTDELRRDYGYIVEADIRSYFDNIDHRWLMKMLELRIEDKTFLRLIKKWLKAGILDVDGKVINPENGCPQGAIVSPILANIYLHYTLDLWFKKVVKVHSVDEAYMCRVADDFVCAFGCKEDATRFYDNLGNRLGKFGLKLSEEKTKVIRFSRFTQCSGESFDFLGFEFRWGKSRKGKNIVKRRTSRSKLRKSIKAAITWCKENRHKNIKILVEMLNQKLRGYFNYYGVINNSKGIGQFYEATIKALYKWLNKRSQRSSYTWVEFRKKLKWYGLITPRVVEKPNNQLRFEECFV